MTRTAWADPHFVVTLSDQGDIVRTCADGQADPYRPTQQDMFAMDWELMRKP